VGTEGVREVGVPGHLLGMLDPVRVHDAEVVLVPGEALVLYTDGVIEARRGDELFGEERLHRVLADHRRDPAQDLADVVASAAVDFQGQDTRDDIAVLVLRAPDA
jgi:phosphoserine phosphatase RsbU/P